MVNKKSNLYRAFGFTILSEISLPELSPVISSETLVDIEIKEADLTTVGKDLSKKFADFIFNNKQVVFNIPNIATFLIEEGKRILFSPEAIRKEDYIRLLLLGTCMGIVLIQRGKLPLHGSVVAINNKAYAILGESGAGKSTLASAFVNRGYKLLTDDVISISFKKDLPYVTPSYPQQKLWESSLNLFGMNSNQYNSLFERETKYAIPLHSNFLDEPLPLAGIFELEKEEGNEIKCFEITSLEKLKTMYTHTYRNFLIPKLGLISWHFHQSVRINNAVDTYRIIRPGTRFTAYELTDLILKTIEGVESNENRFALIK